MASNVMQSHFAVAKNDVNIPRSTFYRDQKVMTTCNAGVLIPFWFDEYLPGSTHSVDVNMLARMLTPIHPVMDDAYIDIAFFAVPNRLVWDHWKEFMGESPEDPYINPVEYSVPQLVIDPYQRINAKIAHNSVLDYMGIPAYSRPDRINALPVRAFCRIWNDFYRDENLMHAIDIDTGDADRPYYTPLYEGTDNPTDDLNTVITDLEYFHTTDYFPDVDDGYFFPNFADSIGSVNFVSDGSNLIYKRYVDRTAIGGTLPPVAKFHDYFTSALKDRQKGDPVAIPLSGFAPVVTLDSNLFKDYIGNDNYPFLFSTSPDGEGSVSSNQYASLSTSGKVQGTGADPGSVSVSSLYTARLAADLGGNSVSSMYATINDLRFAYQTQALLANDARFGTRYVEILKGHFNVDASEGLLQRPEFLGGNRIRVGMNQVLQTSATNDVSPQGNTAGFSLTTDASSYFTKSFVEHGYIIGCLCIRNVNTYQSGVDRLWNRKDRFSFYFPEFANIPDQPIFNQEIFVAENPTLQREFFGFQEPWAEYKFKPNRITGQLRSSYPASLDVWHYADDYNTQPYLSSGWIRSQPFNIRRTLAIQDPLSDQFIVDILVKDKATQPMYLYSNGLSSHF